MGKKHVVNIGGKVYFLDEEEYRKRENEVQVHYGEITEEEYNARRWEIANYKGTEIFYRHGVPEETKRVFKLVENGIPLDLVYRAPVVLVHDAVVDFVIQYVKAHGKGKKDAIKAMVSFLRNQNVENKIVEIVKSNDDYEKVFERLNELLADLIVS